MVLKRLLRFCFLIGLAFLGITTAFIYGYGKDTDDWRGLVTWAIILFLVLLPIAVFFLPIVRGRILRSKDKHRPVESDVLKGFRFIATMSVRTPLYVLQHHNEVHPGPPSALPAYGSRRDGVWLPEVKSWAELVAEGGKPELAARFTAIERSHPPSTMASDLGPIPDDGGDYLNFLLCFRKVIESTVSDEDKTRMLRQLFASEPVARQYADRHGSDLAHNWKRAIR